jgi:uncharacterized membrane protein YhfC
VAYAIYIRKVFKFKDLLAGVFCDLVFGMLVSALWINLVAGEDSAIRNSPALYLIVTCASLAIIEEAGRYLIMYLLRNKLEGRGVPLSFGIGYSVIPLIFVAGSNMYVNLSSATALNNNGLATMLTSVDEELQGELTDTLTSLANTPYTDFIIYAIGLAGMFVLGIAMSIIVWYGVSDKNRGTKYGIVAIILHFIVLVPEELYYCGIIESGFVGEIGTLVLAMAAAAYGYMLYRKMNGAFSAEADHVNRFSL